MLNASVSAMCGFRPTAGRYSRPNVNSTTGTLATNVDDLVILDEILSCKQFAQSKILTCLKGMRIGVWPHESEQTARHSIHPEVNDMYENVKCVISALGASLVDVEARGTLFKSSSTESKEEAYNRLFNKGDLKVIMFPTLRCAPLKLKAAAKYDANFSFIETAPCLSVPMGGVSRAKLPVGLQFSGLAGADQLILAVGLLAHARLK